MTGSLPVHPAIPAFTVGYRARRMGKEAIRAWIVKAKKLGGSTAFGSG